LILLATCRDLPQLTRSDLLLADELRARGVGVRALPWDSIAPSEAKSSRVCLRSTWDYHLRSPEFQEWIETFSQIPGALWNPPDTVLWNLDKAYLRDLEKAGIPLPPVLSFEPGYRPDLKALLAERDWARAVLKPRVSASAHGTHLISAGETLTAEEWVPLLASGALLQEFVPEIQTGGEVSLMFLAGGFSHAVRKMPAPRDFRVQEYFGGKTVLEEPRRELVAFGERVVRAICRPWIYARVDVVETDRGPLLMELELIEPELFLNFAPGAAAVLADALIAHASE